MNEFREFVFGLDKSIGVWCAFMFVMLLGWLFMNVMNVKKRDVQGDRMPVKFSITHFVLDNWKRVLVNLIGVWVYIRYVPAFEPMAVASMAAFVVGGVWEKFLLAVRAKISEKTTFKF